MQMFFVITSLTKEVQVLHVTPDNNNLRMNAQRLYKSDVH